MSTSIKKAGKKGSLARRDGNLPDKPPYIRAKTESTSRLAEDSVRVEWDRRAQEQAGEGHYGKVHVKERHEENENVAPEGELQNDIAQHPLLNSQANDGIDPNLNPEPPLNSEARTEYDNAKRLQHQKKLDLQNQPTNAPSPSSSPTPRPGS